jgi:hypothetical protein
LTAKSTNATKIRAALSFVKIFLRGVLFNRPSKV